MKIIKTLSRTKKKKRAFDYEITFVELADGRRGVFKPRTTVDWMSCLREKIAYDIAKFIKIDNILETELVEYEGRYGSLQRFVEDAIPGMKMLSPTFMKKYKGLEPDTASFQRLTVFDFIVGNYDRWMNNVLVGVGKDNYGKVYGVDHGSIFRLKYITGIGFRSILLQKPTEGARSLIKYCLENQDGIIELIYKMRYEVRGTMMSMGDVFETSIGLLKETISILAKSINLKER